MWLPDKLPPDQVGKFPLFKNYGRLLSEKHRALMALSSFSLLGRNRSLFLAFKEL